MRFQRRTIGGEEPQIVVALERLDKFHTLSVRGGVCGRAIDIQVGNVQSHRFRILGSGVRTCVETENDRRVVHESTL